MALLALVIALGPGVPAMFRADGDVGRHIRVGREMLASGEIPRVDSLSHTRPGGTWVPKEWASQLAMAAADRAFGLSGVATLASILFAASVWLTFLIAKTGGAGYGFSMLAAVLSLLLQLVHLIPRPHLVTTTLLALVVLLLARTRYVESGSGSLRVLFALPVVFAAWVNLHGGFMIGLVVLGLFAADAWVGVLFGDTGLRRATALTAAGAASALATLLNPVGIGIWSHVTRHMGNSFFMDITREFQSPDFHAAYGRLFLLTIVSTAVLVGWRRPLIQRIEGWLYLLGLVAALTSARHIAVFAVVSVPWIAVWMSRATESAAREGVRPAERLEERGANLAALSPRTGPALPLLLGGLAIYLAVGPYAERARFDPAAFPVSALESMPPENFAPEVFNQMRWGGYLLYRYPDIRIFMDGHADFFGEDLTREYLSIRHLAPGWQELLDRYAVNWSLTMPMAPITQALDLSPDWERVYADETAVIHVRAHLYQD